MKHYNQEHYFPREYYRCGHGCDNTTFSTLPRTSEKQIELTVCTRCGIGIVFSTVDLPRTFGYPRSRRTWGEAVPVMQFSTLKKSSFVQANLF